MRGTTVGIVRTGVANTASVAAAFKRLGCDWTFVETASEVERAELLVLPGVGSFGAGMEALRAQGLTSALRDRIAGGLPTLAICLGLQLLCASSEESPGVHGLGEISGEVRKLGVEGVRLPQFGWNWVEADPIAPTLLSGYAYYANSYGLFETPTGWAFATTDYSGTFIAALEKGPVLACQFHPELSGAYGSSLLERWLERAKGALSC